MSAVRVFDVPHIMRYGMIDEKNGETWQIFYRNAVCFMVDIRRPDIVGTPFEQEWSKYAVEHIYNPDPDPRAFVRHYEELCDCILGHILPKLQEIAPVNGHQWNTLEDYLRTPKYGLRLFKDEITGDAIAKIMDGPIIWPAFDMEPQPFSELDIPSDLPRIPASDLIVLDREKDLRQAPNKVRISSIGEIVSFTRCECPRTHQPSGVTENHSLQEISNMLRLHTITEPVNMSKPFAIVTTATSAPPRGMVFSTLSTSPTSSVSTSDDPDPELKVAGLLHSMIPETTQALQTQASITLAASSPTLASQWKTQLTKLLNTLHSHGVVHGNITPWDILIDHSPISSAGNASESSSEEMDYNVWLLPPTSIPNPLYIDPEKAGTEAADWQGLESTFDGWLDFELRKIKGQLKDGEGETWVRKREGEVATEILSPASE